MELIPVSGGESRLARHLRRRHHDHPAAPLDLFAEIVEQVIDLWITQISAFDLTGCDIESARDLAVGVDQQRRHPPGGCGLRDLREVVTTLSSWDFAA